MIIGFHCGLVSFCYLPGRRIMFCLGYWRQRERERDVGICFSLMVDMLCICKVTDEKNAPCVCQDLMCHVICTSNVCVDLVEIIQYFYSLILGVWFYNLQFTKHFKEKVLVRNNVKKITNQYTCNQYKVYSICTQSTEMKYCVYRISVCMVQMLKD